MVSRLMSLAAAQALQSLYDTYEMNKHTQDDSRQAAGLRATFVDHFGIVGPSNICIEKLRSLAALGLDKLFFGVMFRLEQTLKGRAAKVLIEREILPALRSRFTARVVGAIFGGLSSKNSAFQAKEDVKWLSQVP